MATKPKPTATTVSKPEDHRITDENGREMVFRKLSILENARLMRACGDASNIEKFFDLAVVCSAVRSINGDPLPMPKNLNEIDGRINLIGDDGWRAIIANLVPDVNDDDEEVKKPDEVEQLKNS